MHGQGEQERKSLIQILAKDGTKLGELLPERGSHMTMGTCKSLKWLRRASIVSEDRNFYKHKGVSIKGILRAFWRNFIALRIREGGGTLTQQVARNLFTGQKRSFYRKLYETLIAFQLEAKLSKDEIFCLYLNKIYMGEGRVGAEEASWFYFDKAPQKLDPAEASMIVGLFPSPVYYSPLNNIELSMKKQENVLNSLVEMDELSQRERNISRQAFIKRYQICNDSSGRIAQYGASRSFRYNIAPALNEYVKNFLYESLPEDIVQEGGLKVYTSIEKKRQKSALQFMRAKILALRKEMLYKGERKGVQDIQKLSKSLNGAFVSLDANTGNVLAVVGVYQIGENNMSQRVWSMLRQPGSSLKGFLYACALEAGFLKADDIVQDKRIKIGNYQPRNWNNQYLGSVPLALAVSMSINTVALQTLNTLGISRFQSYLGRVLYLSDGEKAKRFPRNLSLALGSGELRPIELARLYAPLINGGHPISSQVVQRVEDQNGDVLWEKSASFSLLSNTVFSKETQNQTVQLMQYVLDPEWQGTASFIGKKKKENSNYLNFSIAGKTGTVQLPSAHKRRFRDLSGIRDAWFVGLVPGEVSVVWLGHDEGAPIVGSGASAASVWASYAQRALQEKVGQTFFLEEYRFEPKKEEKKIEDKNNGASEDRASEVREGEIREDNDRANEVREGEIREDNDRANEVRESKDRESKDRESKVRESKDRESKDRESKDRESKVRESKDRESKDRANEVREDKDRANEVRESKDRESKDRESKDRESKVRESKGREGEDRESKGRGK